MSSTEPLEANVKIRDGKKWKKRFCVLQSAAEGAAGSELALLNVYKNIKFSRKPGPQRWVCRIEGFYGLESGFILDKESRTLAIMCHASVIVLAFDSDPTLHNWESWFRSFFGHGCQYSVHIVETPAAMSILRNVNARLHLRDGRFCLAVDSPPTIAVELTLQEIRRYGAFENKFCVEAGSRTGPLAGVFTFRTGHRDQLAFTFRLAAQGGLHNYLSSNSCDGGQPNISGANIIYGSVQNAERPSLEKDNAVAAAVGCSMIDRRLWSTNPRGTTVTGPIGCSDEMDSGDLDSVFSAAAPSTVSGRSQIKPAVQRADQPLCSARRSASEKHIQQTDPLCDDSPKNNYVNHKRLESPGSYYNMDRPVPPAVTKDPSSVIVASETTCTVLGFTAMAPRESLYGRMDSSITEANRRFQTDQFVDDGKQPSSEVIVQAAEPRILRKELSGTYSWVASGPRSIQGRKYSLPTTLMSERPAAASLKYVRRFSLEEERHARSESPVSTVSVGDGLVDVFRSTKDVAREILRNGSSKAKAFLDSLVHRKAARKCSTTSKENGDAEHEGHEFRAYSEPPMGFLTEHEQRLSMTNAEHQRVEALGSSLDLDEVVYDIASTQNLPPAVLKRIGLKPLVPEHEDFTATGASSPVKLPIGPKGSYGTDSTRSSDSINGKPTSGNQFDGVFDSVSVGSDNSDSDSVFTSRAVRKKSVARTVVDTAKAPAKAKASKTPASTPLSRTSTPLSTLEPHRLSINAQRRLRQDVTKPLSGSYSRYDGDGSCESPLLSPSVFLPPAKCPTAPGLVKQHSITARRDQSCSNFELGHARSRNEKPRVDVGHSQKPNFPISPLASAEAHSPSPPAELAPPPPREETSPSRRFGFASLPRSALPRLEGHIFKFPPLPSLNYALLASRGDRMPTTPLSDGGSCGTPKSATVAGKECGENAVEYAKIDQVATQAARKVVSFRREEARNRWSSSHILSFPNDSSSHQENSEQSTATMTTTSKCRRPFSLKRSLIRRRTSMASLAGV